MQYLTRKPDTYRCFCSSRDMLGVTVIRGFLLFLGQCTVARRSSPDFWSRYPWLESNITGSAGSNPSLFLNLSRLQCTLVCPWACSCPCPMPPSWPWPAASSRLTCSPSVTGNGQTDWLSTPNYCLYTSKIVHDLIFLTLVFKKFKHL